MVVTIRKISERKRSRVKNSPYHECETDEGCVVFWGTDKSTKKERNQKNNMVNINLVNANPLPLTVEYNKACSVLNYPDYEHHDVWIPDSANVKIVQGRD